MHNATVSIIFDDTLLPGRGYAIPTNGASWLNPHTIEIRVSSKGDNVADVLAHEMGHVVQALCALPSATARFSQAFPPCVPAPEIQRNEVEAWNFAGKMRLVNPYLRRYCLRTYGVKE